MDELVSREVLLLYPELASVQPSLAAPQSTIGPVDVAEGALLFEQGQPCSGFPLLLEGEVRVSRNSADGRSIELYRVVPREICLVSSAGLFGGEMLTGSAVATKPTRLVLVLPVAFDQWLAFPQFRQSVLGLFAQRMADLTSLINAIAFSRLDSRLAAALLGHGLEVNATHQALADQLGTVREIVTRLLRRFENEGWVNLSRERIRIVDSAALRELSKDAINAPSSRN